LSCATKSSRRASSRPASRARASEQNVKLPARWELRLRDLNVAPLDDADLRWADAALVSGILVQAPSMREVLLRARAMGRRTVVGGAGPSAAPELFPEADHVFRG
jgi:hypothetical protein